MKRTDWAALAKGFLTSEGTPVCQVCGEDRGDLDLVGCVGCHTIHHMECWIYLGGCSTYSCGSRRAAGEPDLDESMSEIMIHLDLPHQRPAAENTSEACVACKRRWKGEQGVECEGCGATFHPACWVANAGCIKEKCRESAQAHQGPSLSELKDLVSGLGQGNCLVCSGTPEQGERTLCSACGRAYHAGCWKANHGCVHGSCRAKATVPEPDEPWSALFPIPGPKSRKPKGPMSEQELRTGARLTGFFLGVALVLAWLAGFF